MLATLSAQEQQAVAHYNDRIRRGDTRGHPLWVDSFSYPIFHDLPLDGEVIDIGCGIARATVLLPGLGITRYFGIDPAEEQIAYCKRTFPQFGFEVNQIQGIGDSYPNRFDGFLLLSVLMHIPRCDLNASLASLRKALKTGANGFISFPCSDGDVLEYVSPVGDLNCTLYTVQEVNEAFHRNGLVIARDRQDEQMFLGHIVAV